MNKVINNNTKTEHKEKKIIQCSICKANPHLEQIIKILKSHKDPYKKKLDLFNLVKKLEVGEIEPSEERKINILYQGKIYNELAKQTLRDYKKLTAEEFSKVE